MKVKVNIFWYFVTVPVICIYMFVKAIIHIATFGRFFKEEWGKEEVFQRDSFLWLPLVSKGYLYWFVRVRLTFSPIYDFEGTHAGHRVTEVIELTINK
jgi:hypothetical protein